jgi:hypothetical protein
MPSKKLPGNHPHYHQPKPQDKIKNKEKGVMRRPHHISLHNPS